MRPRSPERSGGQAAVAFLGTLPALLASALILAQAAVVGYTAWSAAGAARAAARAGLVGDSESVAQAARAALPAALADRGRVEVEIEGRGGGAVRVVVRAPRLAPLLPTFEVSGSAALNPEAGDAPG